MKNELCAFMVVLLSSTVCGAEGVSSKTKPSQRIGCEKAFQDYRRGETLKLKAPLKEPVINVSNRTQHKILFNGELRINSRKVMECQLSTALEGKTTIDVPPDLRLSVDEPPQYNPYQRYYITMLKSESGRTYSIKCRSLPGIVKSWSEEKTIDFLVKNQFGLSSDLEYEKDVCTTVKVVPASEQNPPQTIDAPTEI